MRGQDLFRYAAIVAVMLCYLTIILGGNVITTDNGLACPHWPTCFGNGNFLPKVSGGAAIEWSHRVSAFVTSVGILALAILGLAYARGRRVLMRLSLLSLGLVIVEALLGGVVVESYLTPWIVLVHLAIATALFGILLIVAVLANLRQLPRRWVEWARRAADESTPMRSTPAPPARPGPSPVGDSPIAGATTREG